jgi:cbb3-type cytochrome oxidase subunit 1
LIAKSTNFLGDVKQSKEYFECKWMMAFMFCFVSVIY